MPYSLVADVEGVEPAPVEEDEQDFDARSHRPQSGLRYLEPARHQSGRVGDKAFGKGEQRNPREHVGWALGRKDPGQRRACPAGYDEALGTALGGRAESRDRIPADPGSLAVGGRVAEVASRQGRRAELEGRESEAPGAFGDDKLGAPPAEVREQPLPAVGMGGGGAGETQLGLTQTRDEPHGNSRDCLCRSQKAGPVGRLPDCGRGAAKDRFRACPACLLDKLTEAFESCLLTLGSDPARSLHRPAESSQDGPPRDLVELAVEQVCDQSVNRVAAQADRRCARHMAAKVPATFGPMAPMRKVKDSMGEMDVPENAYYGASTMRAVLNFPISDLRFPRRFIRALGLIKQAAAEVNLELGLVDERRAAAIVAAAGEVADGRWDAEFVLDIYQTGSGTSTNTNANEVIAFRASEILGDKLGGLVHPNDHVNKCQSSNDVIPSAIQLSTVMAIDEALLPGLQRLHAALADKAREFHPIVKTGRTHLQDATPVRLGQEFAGYAGQVEESVNRAGQARADLLSLPLGGTAVGTGVNAHPEFGARVCTVLEKKTGLAVRETGNHFHAQATLDSLVSAHGRFKTIAVSLWKVGGDVRLMGMGPRAGIGELILPETQPGSSIMPGKVNPVIVESLTMACARVIGNDVTVTLCGQSGSFFELNVMMPIAGFCALESVDLLGRSAANFAERCIEGLVATSKGAELVEKGLMLATALAPVIGYDAAAKLAKDANSSGRTIRELARERGDLSEDDLTRILDPGKMTEPGLESGAGAGG